jgi:hypothetical protein
MDISGRIEKHVSRKTPYSHLLVYVQEFMPGHILNGMIENDLPFSSERDALGWVEAINAKASKGRIEYRVIRHVVVEIPKAPSSANDVGALATELCKLPSGEFTVRGVRVHRGAGGAFTFPGSRVTWSLCPEDASRHILDEQ